MYDARAVLFDWDDTLCGATPHRYETIRTVLERFELARTPSEIHRAWVAADDPVLERVASGFWQRLQRELALDGREDVTEAIMAAFERRAEVLRFDVFPDARAVLDRLSAEGWRLGVISNNVEAARRIEVVGLDGRFDAVVTPRDTGGLGKPDPGIFHLAVERLGARPERTLYVGDTYETDVLGARAAGLRPLLIDRLGICESVDCDMLSSLDEVGRWLW